MTKLWILLLLTVVTGSCADPTRVITNKPKTDEQKQKEREQRQREDKANTEALKNFRITDQALKKTKEGNQHQTTRETSKDIQTTPAGSGK